MNQNFPYEDIIHEINDLLQIIADNADKPLKREIPPDIEAKLAKLEKDVEAFNLISKGYIAQLGITDDDLKAYILKAGAAPKKQRLTKTLERTEQLKVEIEKKKEILETLPKEEIRQPEISISQNKELDKKSPTTRKGLFKRVGGNKKWRPI